MSQHSYRGRGNPRDSPAVRMSKFMSRVLRHKAFEYGLSMDPAGYVRVSDLLALPNMKGCTVEDVRREVAENAKQRFALRENPETGELEIRANQGHTIKSVQEDELLTPITPEDVPRYPEVIHGTYKRFLPAIMASGLNRMKRNHIHFANGRQAASGMRHSCNVLIHLDLDKALEDGIKFYISANGVILSPGIDGAIPTKYFAHVEEL
eukprot:m.107191 g.107191  ORF g.107191 m.107191 type:complete len:208 (+) comp9209_c0_seq3:101-724(+)